MRTPTFSVEVITLPASDLERALRFYVDRVGYRNGVTAKCDVLWKLRDSDAASQTGVLKLALGKRSYLERQDSPDPEGPL